MKRFVAKRIKNFPNRQDTWDVLMETKDGFEHIAEFVYEKHARICAQALNRELLLKQPSRRKHVQAL